MGDSLHPAARDIAADIAIDGATAGRRG